MISVFSAFVRDTTRSFLITQTLNHQHSSARGEPRAPIWTMTIIAQIGIKCKYDCQIRLVPGCQYIHVDRMGPRCDLGLCKARQHPFPPTPRQLRAQMEVAQQARQVCL